MADPSVKLPVGATEVRHWQEFSKRNGPTEPPKATSTK